MKTTKLFLLSLLLPILLGNCAPKKITQIVKNSPARVEAEEELYGVGQNLFAQNNKELLVTYVSASPLFKGDLTAFIMNQIHYPVLAEKDSVEGRVIVTFMIDTLGNTFNHTVVSGVREDLNQEALRVTRLIKFDAPGMQRDEPVAVKFIIPVDFNLKYNQELKNVGIVRCSNKIYEHYFKNLETEVINTNVISPFLKRSSKKNVHNLCKSMNKMKYNDWIYFPISILVDKNGRVSCVRINSNEGLDNYSCEEIINKTMKLDFLPARIDGKCIESYYTLLLRYDKEKNQWFYPDSYYF